ncbi:hypothetical protein QJQ45_016931 [Haematococcus lacustris]|nr:hypothetical protein QJQ45_016931 [Haematococcus lacustris]
MPSWHLTCATSTRACTVAGTGMSLTAVAAVLAALAALGSALWHAHCTALRRAVQAHQAAHRGNLPAPGGFQQNRAAVGPQPSFLSSSAQEERCPDAWRARVGSPLVEFAWDKLCGSIVQQWVYDTWWAGLTPDTEFPAAVRLALNNAFGAVCMRARRLDLGSLLVRSVPGAGQGKGRGQGAGKGQTGGPRDGDVCEVLVEAVEAQRSALTRLGPTRLAALPPAAREAALRAELQAAGALHPALCLPQGHYQAGWCWLVQVLGEYAELLLAALLPGEPLLAARPLRVAARELLASCVLRPVIMMCWPQNIVKAAAQPAQPPAHSSPPAAHSLLLEAEARGQVEGARQFEERCRESERTEKRHARHSRNDSLGGSSASSVSTAAQGRGSAASHTRDRQSGGGGESFAPWTLLSQVGTGSGAGSRPGKGADQGSDGGVDDARRTSTWTVAHRYSDFERLHLALLRHPIHGHTYRGARAVLPPKRLSLLAHDPQFIERRRAELDAYLVSLMSHPLLAASSELCNFLGLYRPATQPPPSRNPSPPRHPSPSPLPPFSLPAHTSIPGPLDSTQTTSEENQQGSATLDPAAPAERLVCPSLQPPPAHPPSSPSMAHLLPHASLQASTSCRPADSDDAVALTPCPAAGRPPPSLVGAGGEEGEEEEWPSRLRTFLHRMGLGGGGQEATPAARAMVGVGAGVGAGGGLGGGGQVRQRSHSTSGTARTPLPLLPTPCPVEVVPGGGNPGDGEPGVQGAGPEAGGAAALAAQPAWEPLGGEQQDAVRGVTLGSRGGGTGHSSGLIGGGGAGGGVGGPGSVALAAVAAPVSGSSQGCRGPAPSGGCTLLPGLSGPVPLSAPLLELLDALCQLSSSGFLGRQAMAVARQLLAMVAGDALDATIAARLHSATSEQALAHALLALQRKLWPGGRWFATAQTEALDTAAAAVLVAGAAAASARSQDPTREEAEAGGGRQASAQPAGPATAHAQAAAEAGGKGTAHSAADDVKAVEGLQHLLLGLLRPGVPLLGLLGGGALQRGVSTLCELLSSATMMLQVEGEQEGQGEGEGQGVRQPKGKGGGGVGGPSLGKLTRDIAASPSGSIATARKAEAVVKEVQAENELLMTEAQLQHACEEVLEAALLDLEEKHKHLQAEHRQQRMENESLEAAVKQQKLAMTTAKRAQHRLEAQLRKFQRRPLLTRKQRQQLQILKQTGVSIEVQVENELLTTEAQLQHACEEVLEAALLDLGEKHKHLQAEHRQQRLENESLEVVVKQQELDVTTAKRAQHRLEAQLRKYKRRPQLTRK